MASAGAEALLRFRSSVSRGGGPTSLSSFRSEGLGEGGREGGRRGHALLCIYRNTVNVNAATAAPEVPHTRLQIKSEPPLRVGAAARCKPPQMAETGEIISSNRRITSSGRAIALRVRRVHNATQDTLTRVYFERWKHQK